MKAKESGDIIITMGAGDIWRYGEEFIKRLKSGKNG
jgi:UDP-N-acetylmuramate-alanine ligase